MEYLKEQFDNKTISEAKTIKQSAKRSNKTISEAKQ